MQLGQACRQGKHGLAAPKTAEQPKLTSDTAAYYRLFLGAFWSGLELLQQPTFRCNALSPNEPGAIAACWRTVNTLPHKTKTQAE